MGKRIGVLTGGGDTSALNATLKGIALKAEELGFELIGFMKGWKGVLKDGLHFTLTPDLIDENQGGTLLKSSRTNLNQDQISEAVDNLRSLGIDGLIPIGGDDTMTVGARLSEMFTTTFVTKTIDNDVGTNPPPGASVDYSQMINYFCPGFPTAASRLISYVRDLRTTAYSHDRVIFVEAMGRDAGWLTLSSAYGHADLIVVPEIPYEPDRLAEAIQKKHAAKGNVIVVVSEGIRDENDELITKSKLPFTIYLSCEDTLNGGGVPEDLRQKLEVFGYSLSQQTTVKKTDNRWEITDGAETYTVKKTVQGDTLNLYMGKFDAFGHPQAGGCSEIIAEEMKKLLPEISGSSFRHVILGYLQRCGSPTPIDRDCALKAGQLAVEALAEGQINYVAAIRRTSGGLQPELLPLEHVIKRDEAGDVIRRSLDLRFYDAKNYQISSAGIAYFRPIFGDLPKLNLPDIESAFSIQLLAAE